MKVHSKHGRGRERKIRADKIQSKARTERRPGYDMQRHRRLVVIISTTTSS